MAKPRIFVSSTFYDLKYIRADLEHFIESMGYEAILNERGHIPYGSQEALDKYCYKEIELCDILVGIIGGRFGALASTNKEIKLEQEKKSEQVLSITQKEIETALSHEKQVYIFIEKNVDSQYFTYQANKENEIDIDARKIKYNGVDDVKIFDFIERIRTLTHNNPIQIFDEADGICNYLQMQWAGLFKAFLHAQESQKYSDKLKEINNTAYNLKTLVDYLALSNEESREAMKDILLSSHPAMQTIANHLELHGKIYFTTLHELKGCLYDLGFLEVDVKKVAKIWLEKYYIFERINISERTTLYIDKIVFDKDQKLKTVAYGEWKENYIRCKFTTMNNDEFNDI